MTRDDDPTDIDGLFGRFVARYHTSRAPRIGCGVRPAVLVVDFARGWTDRDSPMAMNLDSAIAATARVIEAGRPAGAPVIFTTFALAPGTVPEPILVRKSPRVACMTPGSVWVEVDPRLPRRADDLVVAKPSGSAFFGTPLAAHLHERRIDTLFICGCVTSGCVRASAVDAAQHGFRTLVVREAVGDRSPLAHEANLLDIDQRYGDVVSIDESVRYLTQPAAGGNRQEDRP